MRHRWTLLLLGAAAVTLICTFLFIDIGSSWDYILPRRFKRLAAIVLTGGAIAFSTVIFQTITNNRILTPSIIGLDSLYLLLQTAIVFLFGSMTLVTMNKQGHFLLSVGLMVLFAGLLYKLLFRREGKNIFFLLLIGIIFGTFFGSLSSFMQMLIDPNEFQMVQDRMFASMNNVNGDILIYAAVGVLLMALYFLRFAKYMDVLSLGREHALNLGVPYDTVIKRLLIIVAVLISIATALVGPITFLGLLVANIAYQAVRDHRHAVTIPAAILIAVIALVGGQLAVERVFTFTTTLSVIINFCGGVYFLYLLLKENRA